MGARGSRIGSRARLWCGIVVGEERIARVVLTGEAVFVDEPTVSLSDSRDHHYHHHHHLEGSRCVCVSLSLFLRKFKLWALTVKPLSDWGLEK